MRFSSADVEIEAWVETLQGSTRFPEHREERSRDDKSGRNDGQISSYLEIEEGKSFCIKFRCIRPVGKHPDFRIEVEIDGRPLRGTAWVKERAGSSVCNMYIMENGIVKRADLTFASLPKTDEESLVTLQGQAIDRLCKIDVRITQGTYVLCKSAGDLTKTITQAGVGVLYEKNKKLGSTIQPANARAPTARKSYDFYPARQDAALCRFVWTYHTNPELVLMGIIDDVAPAMPAAAAPIAPSEGISELAKLAAQLQPPVKRELGDASQGSVEVVKKVKSERTGTGSENKPIIVAENAPNRTSTTGRVKAEVIDLTDD